MADTLRIFQVDEEGPLRPLIFRGYVEFQKAGCAKPPRSGYRLVYDGALPSTSPESIFSTFNCNPPAGYSGAERIRVRCDRNQPEQCHAALLLRYFRLRKN